MFQTRHRNAATKPCNLQEARTAIAVMKNRIKKSAGFSLVEIMVAMVIGLLGIIVMLQVYAAFEGQKRTTIGGDDAQNGGAIALYGLQHDIEQSGWGISSFNTIGCNLTIPASGVTPARTITLAPVTINPATAIIPAGDLNTDTLLIVSGNGNGGQEGDPVGAAPPAGLLGNNIYAVGSPNEFTTNDRVIAETLVLPTPCNLSLDTVTSVAGANVTVATGVAGMTNGTLYNLGKTQKILAYAIRSGNLTVCDYTAFDCGNALNVGNTSIWVPIASNIVSMKAQYGRDTLSAPLAALGPPYPTYQIDIFDQTTPVNACGWVRTSAIRLVLVARNSQTRQTGVTPIAPAWGGSITVAASGPLPGNTAAPINLTLDPNWTSYRYRVFETIVPIRNISTKWIQPNC